MTASQHSNGLQWSEVYKQCENKKCTKNNGNEKDDGAYSQSQQQ